MELNKEQAERIEELLKELEEVDPAEMPAPAAELANLLGEIVESSEPS